MSWTTDISDVKVSPLKDAFLYSSPDSKFSHHRYRHLAAIKPEKRISQRLVTLAVGTKLHCRWGTGVGKCSIGTHSPPNKVQQHWDPLHVEGRVS